MNVTKLLEAAKEIERRYLQTQERTKYLQKLAADARKSGKSQAHRINEAPAVVDFGGPVEALVAALNAPGKLRCPECGKMIKLE